MIVEIHDIDTTALGAVLAAIDVLGHRKLTDVFARWAFELDWDEVPDLTPDELDMVVRCIDIACRSYSIQFTIDGTPHEFTKRADANDSDSDEPGPDI